MTVLLVLMRFLHPGSLTLLVGLCTFILVVARPASRHAEVDLDAVERFDRGLLWLAQAMLPLAFLAALGWLGAQAVVVTGEPLRHALAPPILGRILTQTAFGHLWQIRLGLLLASGVILWWPSRTHVGPDARARVIGGILLGIALLASLAWAGHAAATEGSWRLPHLAADIGHLLATGAWLGGLVPLGFLLRQARRQGTAAWVRFACEATQRFSVVGLVSVASLTLTGLVNAWVLVGSVAGLVGTPYGRLLLVKLALFLLAVCVAARNRLRLMPDLLAAPRPDEQGSAQGVLRRLERNVWVEAVLGAGVLATVGFLGITPPAEHVQPTWPFPFRLAVGVTWSLPGVRRALLVGALGAALGLLALSYGIGRRRYRGWAIGVGVGLVLFYGGDALRHLAVDAYPTTYQRSPVAYQVASIANGLRLYRAHCTACHGANGFGDGPAGRGLRPPPADLTARHTGDHTAGDLFWWLSHGIRGSAMPGFQDQLSETDRWDLINFLRALSAAEQARGVGPVVEPTPWLVAPDFVFAIGGGPEETLKEQRGKVMVHLVLFGLPGSLPRLGQLAAASSTIAAAGARFIAVPMKDYGHAIRMGAGDLPVAPDGGQEIAAAYTLFRRTLNTEGVPPPPDHLEFLIDRQGYVRARWIPNEGPGWSVVPRLVAQIQRLAQEPPGAPAPDEHVH